jgi:hypothetical protein
MADNKHAVWGVFSQFQTTDIDLTFKRAPGTFWKQLGAEEKTVVERPSRRPCSAPPKPMEKERAGPKQGCKPAGRNIDKVTATLACEMYKCTSFEGRPVSRVGIGTCSPQAGAFVNAVPKSTIDADFVSRGVMDIDQTSRKAVMSGHKAKGTTWDKAWEFSEEQAAELKRCIGFRSAVERESTETVQALDGLGIECRRLKGASTDHAYARRRFVQQRRPEIKQGPSAPRRPEVNKSAQQPEMSKLSKAAINTRCMQLAYEKQAAKFKLKRIEKAVIEISEGVVDDATSPVYKDAKSDERTSIPSLDLTSLAEKIESGSACSTAYDDSDEDCEHCQLQGVVIDKETLMWLES